MDKFFEITLTYYDVDENSTSMKIKKFTNVIACEAVNYTEAEALATKWGEENINVDFEISPIKELNVFRFIPNEDKEGSYYVVKGVWIEINEKGKEKVYNVNYLIQARTTNEANKIALEEMDELYPTVRIADIKETKILYFVKP